MDSKAPNNRPSDPAKLSQEIEGALHDFVGALLAQDADQAAQDFKAVYDRARHLVHRKVSMRGTRSETRDLLGELIFSRMRRAIRDFVRGPDVGDPSKCAQWVMGSMLGMGTLSEFATAIDRAILEMSAPREYSFAGMADFISIEEVLQLLGAGKHVGCLTFEKPDNRLDIYLNAGRIAFLDPHHMIRRVLPGSGTMNYREITEKTLREAEQVHTDEQMPLFLALHRAGSFRDLDLRGVMVELGVEVFQEFLMEPEVVFFSYLRLAELPDFAQEYDLRLGITPILLEGNRRLDDWRSMSKVFPDRHEPIEPVENMYAKIGHLDLGILDIKLLAHINGQNSPKAIGEAMGLPIYETYQHLVRLAREGAILAPGGMTALTDVNLSVEDSMKLAFEALDANDDTLAASCALDKVLGDDEAFAGLFGTGDAARGEGGKLKVSLDFFKSSDDERD